jgi:phospho-N-acetylmuramoyl-pentapeptide-transferase
MIYFVSQLLTDSISAFNVVHYVSFRTIAGLLSTLFLSIGFGGLFIDRFGNLMRSGSREFTPQNHQGKGNMPSMGGIFILLMVLINACLWCDLSQSVVLVFLGGTLAFGLIGLWDDLHKVWYRRGISALAKSSLQFLVAFGIAVVIYSLGLVEPSLVFPFFKYVQPSLGLLLVPWMMFVIIGTSNAVNLTDGLDGLAMNAVLPNFATFSIICYLASHAALSAYLTIPFVYNSELVVLGGIMIGASLGFLWFNTYPAQIFMGDVGSLSLGCALALMGILSKHELLLVISGGLLVIETLSVIIQVLSFRYFKRRVFRMAPIHHHFELMGWPESKITVRFGIISLVLCLLALLTLKVR